MEFELKQFRNTEPTSCDLLFPVFTLLRQKKSLRFVVVTLLLTGAALGASLLSAIASQVRQYDLASLGSKAALGLVVLIVLYAVPQLARNVQWRSDYAMQVPNAGLIFSVAILLVTILALSSGNNLLYLVLAVLLATMIVSIISARLNLRRLTPSVHYPDHIFVGDKVPFEVTLKSEKRLLPSFSLSVDLVEERQSEKPEIKGLEQKAFALGYFPLLPARARGRIRIERSFDKRGIYPVTGFVINTGFPFGFIEQRRFIEWSGEIAVYPQPLPIEDFSHLLPMMAGRVESHARGSGSDLYAIRQYLASDHHHHIDWKATAKTNRVMVREFTRDDDWRVTIIFDSKVDKQTAENEDFASKFERAITFAASLTDHFINLGAEVRLIANGVMTDFGTSQSHYFRILRELARLSPSTNEEKGAEIERDQKTSFEILISPIAGHSPARSNALSMHTISFEEL